MSQTTKELRSELETRGVLEITAENIRAASRIKRGQWVRLRRWAEIGPDSSLVREHGYPADRKMLRDMPAAERPQVGDVIVRQYAAVG